MGSALQKTAVKRRQFTPVTGRRSIISVVALVRRTTVLTYWSSFSVVGGSLDFP